MKPEESVGFERQVSIWGLVSKSVKPNPRPLLDVGVIRVDTEGVRGEAGNLILRTSHSGGGDYFVALRNVAVQPNP